MELFPEGKLETDEQKALREENEKLRAKQYEMLAAWIAACCRMLRLLLAQNPFIFVCAKAHDRACSLDCCMLSHAAAFACAKPVYFRVR